MKVTKSELNTRNSPDLELVSRIRSLKQATNLVEECSNLLSSFSTYPNLLRPAAAMLLERIRTTGDDAEIARFEHVVSDAGIGAVEPREETERVRQQLRSTIVSQNDFWPAAALLSELSRRHTCQSIWIVAGRKMTLDVMAIFLIRSESDGWAKKRLRKTLFSYRGEYTVEGRQIVNEMPWLQDEIELRIGKPKANYVVRLVRGAVDSVREPHGSVGIVAVATIVIFGLWCIGLVLKSTDTVAHASEVQSAAQVIPNENVKVSAVQAAEVDAKKDFVESMEQRLSLLSEEEQQALFVVLPTTLDDSLTDSLSKSLPNAMIIGSDRLRSLGVHSSPASHRWFPDSMGLIGASVSPKPADTAESSEATLSEKPSSSYKVYVAQLRVDSLERPVFEVADPDSGQILLLLIGDQEAAEKLLSGRDYIQPSTAEYLKTAVAAMGRNAEYAQLFLRLAHATANTDAQRGKVWKTRAQIHDHLKEISEGDAARRMADFYESIDD